MMAPAGPTARGPRAVIDIGTNSVKLLVAEVAPAEVIPLVETSEQTRLGRGFYEGHSLQRDAMERTVQAVLRLQQIAASHGACDLRIIATSATREARNRAEFERRIVEACHTPLRVLTGEEEAEWTYRGVASDSRFGGESLVVIDVGGGSTEVIVGVGATAHFRHSQQLGTVRLLEGHPLSDPPRADEWIEVRKALRSLVEQEVLPEVGPWLGGTPGTPHRGVGASGTATLLARMELGFNSYDRELLEAVAFSPARLGEWRDRLWTLTLEERRTIPGLPSEKADVILAGVAIYEALMDILGLSELAISMRGLRFAALVDG